MKQTLTRLKKWQEDLEERREKLIRRICYSARQAKHRDIQIGKLEQKIGDLETVIIALRCVK